MKIGLISDIHGNLEALQSVLQAFERYEPDLLVCLGDIVGYGADPNACVDLCFERSDILVRGNHDDAVASELFRVSMNAMALEAARWTLEQLTDVNLQRLAMLPMIAEHDHLLFVHASPNCPDHWSYMHGWDDTGRQFDAFTQRVCCIGHSHIPGIQSPGSELSVGENWIALARDDRYIINVGSVGQPRDGNTRACAACFDTETWNVNILRVPYDITAAADKIRRAGLPEYLAQRLNRGR
jgi:predicted phosphodiesterase